jgi:hypothetical protein
MTLRRSLLLLRSSSAFLVLLERMFTERVQLHHSDNNGISTPTLTELRTLVHAPQRRIANAFRPHRASHTCTSHRHPTPQLVPSLSFLFSQCLTCPISRLNTILQSKPMMHQVPHDCDPCHILSQISCHCSDGRVFFPAVGRRERDTMQLFA